MGNIGAATVQLSKCMLRQGQRSKIVADVQTSCETCCKPATSTSLQTVITPQASAENLSAGVHNNSRHDGIHL